MTLYIVGIGPGGRENMTLKAIETIKKCEVIVAYTPYLNYIEDLIEDKEIFSNGMRGEIERCKKAVEFAKSGKDTAIISTGDAGLYGMAGPIYELAEDIDIEVVPGVTAAFSAASELGAPIMHDCALISLSDLLTPWDLILKRIKMAGEGDFVIALYNPRSKGRPDNLKEALEVLHPFRDDATPVGIVRNSGRDDKTVKLVTFDTIPIEEIDMKTVLIIGNSKTYIKDHKMITPRGYENK
ncbi:MAG: precorrin-3B C(17)-methyltransferase [Tissierellia bacterium]|nr:precorrin-3B C(17)-methyltransferase [Tissierellia bacterium]